MRTARSSASSCARSSPSFSRAGRDDARRLCRDERATGLQRWPGDEPVRGVREPGRGHGRAGPTCDCPRALEHEGEPAAPPERRRPAVSIALKRPGVRDRASVECPATSPMVAGGRADPARADDVVRAARRDAKRRAEARSPRRRERALAVIGINGIRARGSGRRSPYTGGVQDVLTVPNEVAAELAGVGDGVLDTLRERLGCSISLRGNRLTLDGDERTSQRPGRSSTSSSSSSRAGTRSARTPSAPSSRRSTRRRTSATSSTTSSGVIAARRSRRRPSPRSATSTRSARRR